MISNKIIFISPLDWGMGHSTRCVPLIKELIKNNKVIIGTTVLNKVFFDQHFPGLQKINLPSYNIQYSKKIPVWFKILLQSKKIKSVINEENKLLEKIIDEHKIELVISDNRFGLHSKKAETIFISHQLNIKSPVFSVLANKINLNYIHKFNKVWVPDYENKNERLAGWLSVSDHLKIPVKYIGPLSALKDLPEISLAGEKTDYLILLSGVEPQRSILEKKLLERFKTSIKKIVLVRGSNTEINSTNKNIKVIDFAFGMELKNLIVNAETVICRSGYSTLMDLHLLNKKKIILIPTPGQPEQEYLAAYWKEKFNAAVCLQKEISSSNLI